MVVSTQVNLYVYVVRDGSGKIVDAMVERDEPSEACLERFRKKWRWGSYNLEDGIQYPLPLFRFSEEFCITSDIHNYFWGKDLIDIENAIKL